MTPQLIVTLSPQGKLLVELPGANGARRKVELAHGIGSEGQPQVETALLRILQGQLSSRVEIGLDGAPTEAQVRHWQRHEVWADPLCRFCLAEKRFTTSNPNVRRKGRGVLLGSNGQGAEKVEIRRLPPSTKREKAKPVRSTTYTIEELGL